jgi:hypothetical protein
LSLVLASIASSDAPALSKAISALFGLLFVFGIWCGLQMIERPDGALALNRLFWAIQIPLFSSGFAGYQFSCGAQVYVFVDVLSSAMRFSAQIGSQFQYSIMQPQQPLLVGVNLFAVGVAFYLSFCLHLARIAPPPP